ncbi:hypothetical protein NDU88_009500 [Pleurodeles waltl]|uniref:Uncharacterized protein n=1 Tax=Pleurodeles waltl TaxID=8319 RepID=A0AAV7S169_PLEWA|nr:hypothetical protein NDU88_009500 [Pleurodeles waltl]
MGDSNYNALKLELVSLFERNLVETKPSLLAKVLSNNKKALKKEYVQAHPKILEWVNANMANAMAQMDQLLAKSADPSLIKATHEDLRQQVVA